MNEPDGSYWRFLPYPALINIFKYLTYKDLVAAGQVCKSWYQTSLNDLLWKELFFKNFLVDKSVPVVSG